MNKLDRVILGYIAIGLPFVIAFLLGEVWGSRKS